MEDLTLKKIDHFQSLSTMILDAVGFLNTRGYENIMKSF